MPSGTAPLVVLRLSPPPAAASVASPPDQQSGPHGRDFLRHLVHLAGPRGLPLRFVGRSNVETMGTSLVHLRQWSLQSWVIQGIKKHEKKVVSKAV